MMPIAGPDYFAVDKLTFAIFEGYENLYILRKRCEDEKNLHIIYSRQWEKRSLKYWHSSLQNLLKIKKFMR